MNRLLGDVKWKGKDPAEKPDPPQDTDVTVQELVDTTITEVVPVRKRQYVALTIFSTIHDNRHFQTTPRMSLKSHLMVFTQVKINTNFQRKIVNIFLPINFNICFGCSKEPSH